MRIIGVDGGGSKTHAYLVDENLNILDEYFSSGTNYLTVGIDRAEEIIIEICKKFNFDSNTILSLGLAGLSREKDIKIFKNLMKDLKIENYILNNDVYTALIGAFEGKDGSLLIAGTGSICYSLSNGNIKRYGGYGHLIGDYGSGYMLGKKAINLAFETRDGLEDKKNLLALIIDHYKIKDLDELLYIIYNDFHKDKIASLAKVLIDNINVKGIKEIVDKEISNLLKLTNKLEVNSKIALGGSLLTNDNYYSQRIKKELRENFDLVQTRHNATMGACIIGLGWKG